MNCGRLASEFGDDFYAAVTLEATLDCHDVIGGTATARVKAALREQTERVAALEKCGRTGGGSCWCVRPF